MATTEINEGLLNYAAALKKLLQAEKKCEELKNKEKIQLYKKRNISKGHTTDLYSSLINEKNNIEKRSQTETIIQTDKKEKNIIKEQLKIIKERQEKEIQKIREKSKEAKKNSLETLVLRKKELLQSRSMIKQSIQQKSIENIEVINYLRQKLLEENRKKRQSVLELHEKKEEQVKSFRNSRIKEVRDNKKFAINEVLSRLKEREKEIKLLSSRIIDEKEGSKETKKRSQSTQNVVNESQHFLFLT